MVQRTPIKPLDPDTVSKDDVFDKRCIRWIYVDANGEPVTEEFGDDGRNQVGEQVVPQDGWSKKCVAWAYFDKDGNQVSDEIGPGRVSVRRFSVKRGKGVYGHYNP